MGKTCYISGMKIYKSRYFPCLLIFAVAIIVRLVSYHFWLASPFTEYHLINGLDMMTHMRFGLNFANGDANFSLHKLICWAMIKLTGQDIPIKGLILCQHLIGVFVPVLVFLLSLRLSRNKFLAIIAGIFVALYSPALMYESFALVESLFLATALLSTLAVLYAERRWRPSFFIAGVLVLFPTMVRFSGVFLSALLVLWFFLRLSRKKGAQKSFDFIMPSGLFLSGMLFSISSVATINYLNCGELYFFPGKPVLSYILKAGSEIKINPEDDIGDWSPKDSTYLYEKKMLSYISKSLDIISPYEMPNNLNYYFIRNQLPLLKYLIGPLLLIPLAVSGFLLSLARPFHLKRFYILFFYFVAVATPILVFLPLARYRIALLPVFAFFAASYVVSLRGYLRISQDRPLPLLLSLLVYVVVFVWSIPSSLPLRSEDFLAYGESLERKNGDIEERLLAYLTAYKLSPTSQSAVIHLANHLMLNGNFSDAKVILEEYCRDKKNVKTIIMLASARLGTGEFASAKELILSIPEPREGISRVNYLYQLGEANRLLGETAESMRCYERAFDLAENESQRQIIKSAMDKFPVTLEPNK